MAVYLKKFETQAAYEAAQSGLILPNVSLTVDNNTVHYNPSTPTPSLSVVAVYDSNEEQVELPYCDGYSTTLVQFNRPISYEELSRLKIEARQCGSECESTIGNAQFFSDMCVWNCGSDFNNCSIICYPFEGTTDTIELQADGDYEIEYFGFYIE